MTTRQADFHSECMRSLTEASPLIDPGLSDIYFYQTRFCGEETAGIPLELPQRASDKSRLLQIDQFGRMDKVHARIRYSWRFMCRFRSAASSILAILVCGLLGHQERGNKCSYLSFHVALDMYIDLSSKITSVTIDSVCLFLKSID